MICHILCISSNTINSAGSIVKVTAIFRGVNATGGHVAFTFVIKQFLLLERNMKKYVLLFGVGALLFLLSAIFKPASQQLRSEPSIGTPSLQEDTSSMPQKSDIIPEVTEDFPEEALSALISFKKLQNDFFYRRFQFQFIDMGKRLPVSPYVYYDVHKEFPSIKNSMFYRDDRRYRRRVITDIISDGKKEAESPEENIEIINLKEIMREIVGEEGIDTNRCMALNSYGSYPFPFPAVSYDTEPISYENFLISVFLMLSEIRIGMPDTVYLSFLEDVLLPLSHDLAQKGPARPPVVINDEFIERMYRYVHQDRSKLPKWLYQTKFLIASFTFPEPIPHEILCSGIYRKIDHLIRDGFYKDPYYLFNYYKTLCTKGDDTIRWGEALDADIWRNYCVMSLIAHQEIMTRDRHEIIGIDDQIDQIEEKTEEIKTLILNLWRCGNAL